VTAVEPPRACGMRRRMRRDGGGVGVVGVVDGGAIHSSLLFKKMSGVVISAVQRLLLLRLERMSPVLSRSGLQSGCGCAMERLESDTVEWVASSVEGVDDVLWRMLDNGGDAVVDGREECELVADRVDSM
jgi:hypothetical protein